MLSTCTGASPNGVVAVFGSPSSSAVKPRFCGLTVIGETSLTRLLSPGIGGSMSMPKAVGYLDGSGEGIL